MVWRLAFGLILITFIVLIISFVQKLPKKVSNSLSSQYNQHGLTFRYDPKWTLDEPSELYGQSIGWGIIIGTDSSRMTNLRFELIRDYPTTGNKSRIESYLDSYYYNAQIETNQLQKVQKTTFKDRSAISAKEDDGFHYPVLQLVIDLPEINGLFSATYLPPDPHKNFDDQIATYFTPWLESLEIQPELAFSPVPNLVIKDSSESSTSSWRKFQGTHYSLLVPPSWRAKEQIIENEPTIEIEKIKQTQADLICPNDPPPPYVTAHVYLGSPLIYSTSGTICGNAPRCSEEGQLQTHINKFPLFASLRGKICSRDSDQIFYSFQTSVLDASPAAYITGSFQSTTDGEMITTILSTVKN